MTAISEITWRQWKKELCAIGKTKFREYFNQPFLLKDNGGIEAWKELWKEGVDPLEAMENEVSYD